MLPQWHPCSGLNVTACVSRYVAAVAGVTVEEAAAALPANHTLWGRDPRGPVVMAKRKAAAALLAMKLKYGNVSISRSRTYISQSV